MFQTIHLNSKLIGSISVSPFHGSNKCSGEHGYDLEVLGQRDSNQGGEPGGCHHIQVATLGEIGSGGGC